MQEIQLNFYYDQTDRLHQQVLASLYFYTYRSSLVLVVNHRRKWCHFVGLKQKIKQSD